MEQNDNEPTEEQHPLMVKRQGEAAPRIVRITKRQKEMLDVFLATGRLSDVARECRVSQESAKEFLHRDEVQEYLKERIRQTAHKIDLTQEKILTKINEIVNSDGTKKYEPTYLRALELASRILKMIQPQNINIAMQQSNNPLQEMKDDELDKMIFERANYVPKEDSRPPTDSVRED